MIKIENSLDVRTREGKLKDDNQDSGLEMRPCHLLRWNNLCLKLHPLLSFGHGNIVRHNSGAKLGS